MMEVIEIIKPRGANSYPSAAPVIVTSVVLVVAAILHPVVDRVKAATNMLGVGASFYMASLSASAGFGVPAHEVAAPYFNFSTAVALTEEVATPVFASGVSNNGEFEKSLPNHAAIVPDGNNEVNAALRTFGLIAT